VVEGHHLLNTSSFVVHSPIHELRPDVTAAAHGHTVHSRALSSLGRLLIPLDQESAAFYQQQALYEDYEGPSITLAQGRDMAHKLGDHRVLLLKHHGLVTVGESLEEAVHWFFTYETCAQVQLLASAAGTPRPLTHEQALAAAEGFGAPDLARFSFELLWEDITHEHPDLLDE
jgi:ribulose-5-phosphate 4-epimerase/fuculose-1-phosphate aldolase